MSIPEELDQILDSFRNQDIAPPHDPVNKNQKRRRTSMSNFRITARHPGMGTIAFIVPSSDPKTAFGVWKNIVFSPRQWSIVSNEPTDGGPAALQPVQALAEYHAYDCACELCSELRREEEWNENRL